MGLIKHCLVSTGVAVAAVLTALQVGATPPALNAAISDQRSMRWYGAPHSVHAEYTRYDTLMVVRQYYLLSLTAYSNSQAASPQTRAIRDKIISHLDSAVSRGHEPAARGAIAGWADGALAMGLALNRRTPAIWNQLSPKTRYKLDWLMKALVIAGNWTHHYANDAHVGLCGSFATRKTWNPNIQEGYVGVMIAAYYYFGGSQPVNTILHEFSYDKYMAKFQQLGFSNIANCWKNTGKDLMESGGTDINGGQVIGVNHSFSYELITPDITDWPEAFKTAALALINEGPGGEAPRVPYDPYRLYEALALRFYDQQISNSSSRCYALNWPPSMQQLEGEWGMAHEFASSDSYGERCSPRYVFDGWANNIPILAMLMAFGALDTSRHDKAVEQRIQATLIRMLNGSEHLISAYEGGYVGRQNGVLREFVADGSGGAQTLGYTVIKAVYQDFVKPHALELIQVITDGSGLIATDHTIPALPSSAAYSLVPFELTTYTRF